MEINWDEAPEGYPLWIEFTDQAPMLNDGWFRQDESGYYVQKGENLYVSPRHADSGRIIVHRRPETVAWDGEGLPPVGAECEYSMTSGKRFKPCFFVGIKSTGSYVIESHDGELKSYHPYQVVFRPIPTPEQKAAQERERAIDEMEKVIMGSVSIRDGVTKLYSIGYRYYDGGES